MNCDIGLELGIESTVLYVFSLILQALHSSRADIAFLMTCLCQSDVIINNILNTYDYTSMLTISTYRLYQLLPLSLTGVRHRDLDLP